MQQNIGSIVRFHRKKAGLSQKELARLANVGKTVIFDIEKNKRTIRLDTLEKVFRVLNIIVQLKSPLMEIYETETHTPSQSESS